VKSKNLLAIFAILSIAVILRPPVALVGPIISAIEKSLNLSVAESSLLTAIPVMCFGFGAFLAPALVKKFGVNHTLVGVTATVFVSIVLRPFFGYVVLLGGTILLGVAIAVANVLLPTVVRTRFHDRVTLITSLYTTALSVAASAAAFFSFPASEYFGWEISTVIWAIPALLALVLSFSLLSTQDPHATTNEIASKGSVSTVLRSSMAWSIVAFFGIQSFGFYALLAWLPSIAIFGGLMPLLGGLLVSFTAIVGVPVGLLLSANLNKFKSVSLVALFVSMVTATGVLLLVFQQWWLAATVIGIGQASSFPLSLTLISTKARDQHLTTVLSSMAQGLGYLFAALGTFFFGFIGKGPAGWQISLWLLFAFSLVQAVVGFLAGRPKQIG